MSVRGIPIHPAAAAVLAREQWAQRTESWYAVRQGLITASDAAAALKVPPFATCKGCPREECLKKKLDNLPFSNIFCAHGQKYEDEALRAAMDAMGDVAYEVGLLRHPVLPWLAASPDGITHSGKCVEIKCPMRRAIVPGHVPHHYFPQIQTQMEVTGLEETVFIEYKPSSLTRGAPQLSIVVVQRDRQWFARHKDALHSFWSEYMERKRTHVAPPPPPPPTCIVVDGLYDDDSSSLADLCVN